jgi:hypothetical protein
VAWGLGGVAIKMLRNVTQTLTWTNSLEGLRKEGEFSTSRATVSVSRTLLLYNQNYFAYISVESKGNVAPVLN